MLKQVRTEAQKSTQFVILWVPLLALYYFGQTTLSLEIFVLVEGGLMQGFKMLFEFVWGYLVKIRLRFDGIFSTISAVQLLAQLERVRLVWFGVILRVPRLPILKCKYLLVNQLVHLGAVDDTFEVLSHFALNVVLVQNRQISFSREPVEWGLEFGLDHPVK